MRPINPFHESSSKVSMNSRDRPHHDTLQEMAEIARHHDTLQEMGNWALGDPHTWIQNYKGPVIVSVGYVPIRLHTRKTKIHGISVEW
ncbi:hypothetical protein JTE90_014462 [Oedothorax gibbosus]|uniref:Uncharacterized protein n=1 Tax=Oedothorax gibbosus TaxID=931172 RepID=A0AAV6VM08_9ARAC|nr:hypothetical protein JTE90_014462 [Oedothorax gibbosus]